MPTLRLARNQQDGCWPRTPAAAPKGRRRDARKSARNFQRYSCWWAECRPGTESTLPLLRLRRRTGTHSESTVSGTDGATQEGLARAILGSQKLRRAAGLGRAVLLGASSRREPVSEIRGVKLNAYSGTAVMDAMMLDLVKTGALRATEDVQSRYRRRCPRYALASARSRTPGSEGPFPEERRDKPQGPRSKRAAA